MQKEIKAKIDAAAGTKDNSPLSKRRQELVAELKDIRLKQGGAKDARMCKMGQIKKLDEKLRSHTIEQKSARGKMEFKSETDLDATIQRLESQVNSGTMKLVDEKKALDSVSRYRKLKKNFGQFSLQQKEIERLKSEISEIKKSMDDPEAKALSDRYTAVQAELDSVKTEQDLAFKNLNSLRDERSKLQTLQLQQFECMKKLKDDHYSAKRAVRQFEDECWAKKKQRYKEKRDQELRDKRTEHAREVLSQASEPAYLEEIRRAENLWHFFDPTHEAEKKSIIAESGLRATVQRTVDDSAFKGMKVVRKEDRHEDFMPAVKKGKKGKKSHTSSVAADKFNCPPSIMEDCAFLAIPVPASQADVPLIIDKIKHKVEHWRADQEVQTLKVGA